MVGESGFEPLKSLTADLQSIEQMYKLSVPENPCQPVPLDISHKATQSAIFMALHLK